MNKPSYLAILIAALMTVAATTAGRTGNSGCSLCQRFTGKI